MPQTFEIVWALLPLFYILVTIVALIKKILGSKLYAPIKDYLAQLLFCSICFFVSILIVRSSSFSLVISYYPLSILPAEVFKWVLYPIVLVISSMIVDKRKTSKSTQKKSKIK